MNDFKVGDWILDHLNGKHKFKVKEEDDLKKINSMSRYALWEPTYGEWCWFYKYEDSTPIYAQFKGRDYITGRYGTEYEWYDICEPS